MVQDRTFTGAKEFSTLNYIILQYSDTDTQILFMNGIWKKGLKWMMDMCSIAPK